MRNFVLLPMHCMKFFDSLCKVSRLFGGEFQLIQVAGSMLDCIVVTKFGLDCVTGQQCERAVCTGQTTFQNVWPHLQVEVISEILHSLNGMILCNSPGVFLDQFARIRHVEFDSKKQLIGRTEHLLANRFPRVQPSLQLEILELIHNLQKQPSAFPWNRPRRETAARKSPSQPVRDEWRLCRATPSPVHVAESNQFNLQREGKGLTLMTNCFSVASRKVIVQVIVLEGEASSRSGFSPSDCLTS